MVASNPFAQASPGFERLFIVGAGGFGREVAWLAEQAWGDAVERVFLVDREDYLGDPVNGVRVELLGAVALRDGDRCVVGVGDPAARRRLAAACAKAGLAEAVLVHPRAEMSATVTLGAGTIVCAGSICTVNIRTGRHVHVNLDCTIGHDVTIGDFTTLAPGVHVSGRVRIGSDVFIGTGATIIDASENNRIEIGDGAVVAAGACVIQSVDAGALVAGVPAVRKR